MSRRALQRLLKCGRNPKKAAKAKRVARRRPSKLFWLFFHTVSLRLRADQRSCPVWMFKAWKSANQSSILSSTPRLPPLSVFR
jgi:hypothetical protein